MLDGRDQGRRGSCQCLQGWELRASFFGYGCRSSEDALSRNAACPSIDDEVRSCQTGRKHGQHGNTEHKSQVAVQLQLGQLGYAQPDTQVKGMKQKATLTLHLKQYCSIDLTKSTPRYCVLPSTPCLAATARRDMKSSFGIRCEEFWKHLRAVGACINCR